MSAVDLTEPVDAHDEAIRSMLTGSPSRRAKLMTKFEHAVTYPGRGRGRLRLPVVWLAPKGTKARGIVEHIVPVEAGCPTACACGAPILPFTAPEIYLLEAIAEHFDSLAVPS